ncbi:hypothetical protein [Burkholderia sp.]|uniref:hypothetical protein n=1 Tax=Burkholderia sp. TaxID=36773 RepID=UPI0025BB35F1|nr:hypothetical protein [Burkholderia sp.]MBS6360692.1 hypothetical protein [Burkholderia sp.]
MSESQRSRTLFFVSRRPELGVGLIEPGSWSKEYDQYYAGRHQYGDPWMLIIEQAIEIERLTSHPDKPSRLRSSFACTTLEAAKSLTSRSMFGDSASLRLWACELVKPDAPVHVGSFRLFEKLRTAISYRDAHEIARSYWSASHPLSEQELITESPLRLTQCLYIYHPGLGWQSAVTRAHEYPTPLGT